MGCSYRDLVGWQKATAMVTEIYRATQSFPREEIYGLTLDQSNKALGGIGRQQYR